MLCHVYYLSKICTTTLCNVYCYYFQFYIWRDQRVQKGNNLPPINQPSSGRAIFELGQAGSTACRLRALKLMQSVTLVLGREDFTALLSLETGNPEPDMSNWRLANGTLWWLRNMMERMCCDLLYSASSKQFWWKRLASSCKCPCVMCRERGEHLWLSEQGPLGFLLCCIKWCLMTLLVPLDLR